MPDFAITITEQVTYVYTVSGDDRRRALLLALDIHDQRRKEDRLDEPDTIDYISTHVEERR